MKATWAIARKELYQLVRDKRAAILLLVMPIVFIVVLGLLLGEGFGQKPDDRTRIVIVDLDRGPGLQSGKTWSQEVEEDLKDTAGIRIEKVASEQEAFDLVDEHRQAAVLVFQPTFSEQVNKCSFLTDGINPFYRDGVYLDRVHATLKKDSKQPGQAAIIEQVAQVTLLRVILPYMIGKAFEKLHEKEFIDLLGKEVRLPVPKPFQLMFPPGEVVEDKASLNAMLVVAAKVNKDTPDTYKSKVGDGIQAALREQFRNYELTGMTWAKLTRSKDPRQNEGGRVGEYVDKEGAGVLHRGAFRYQVLVPGFTVMFAFFLAVVVGWLFVAERRQGTLKRLRAAPITRAQVLLGKLAPYFLLSLAQGAFLLIIGKLALAMRWGPADWTLGQQVLWLTPVVVTTSLAAMGLSMLVAALAKTEMQVALYAVIPVLVLALIGGCVLPREMMPEQTQVMTLLTPQGWALDAYRELLDPDPNARPNLAIVLRACGVLAAFGMGSLGVSWSVLRLE